MLPTNILRQLSTTVSNAVISFLQFFISKVFRRPIQHAQDVAQTPLFAGEKSYSFQALIVHITRIFPHDLIKKLFYRDHLVTLRVKV